MSSIGRPARRDDPDDVFAEFFGGERHADTGERYLVELESLVVAIFKRCEGLTARRQVIEVQEGGREKPVKRLGPYAEGAFTLLEGEADGPDIFRWYERGREADHMASSRRSGSVILVDRRGLEVARWKFRHAMVSGWDGPAEAPDPAEPYAIGRLEVTHEGLEMVIHDR